MKISRSTTHLSVIGAIILGASLTLTGCVGQESGGGQSQSTTQVAFPDSELGQNAEWVLEQLNGDADTIAADWKGKLAPTLVAEMTPQDLVDIINSEIRPRGPFTPTDFSAGEGNAQTELLAADGKHIRFALMIDPAEGLISGIHFTPTSS